VPFERMAGQVPLSCPKCFSGNIQPMPLPSTGSGRGGRRRFRGRRRW
jgi:hypothetical protein